MESLADFVAVHEPALERDEVKHGVLLDILGSDLKDRAVDYWNLGEPGHCAVKVWSRRVFDDAPEDAHWSIILGDLDRDECRHLAEMTLRNHYPGVIGSDLTAQWFAARASELGIEFVDVEPQQIYMLDDPPVHPNVPGMARPITPDDTDIFTDWLPTFSKESSPHDPLPTYAECEEITHENRYFFWVDHDEIVSMAGIARRLTKTAAITGVYTPPEYRGRGYAAAVTAAVVEHIHLEGRTATLYTDLRNPFANKCYVRIGFRGVYTSLHFHR